MDSEQREQSPYTMLWEVGAFHSVIAQMTEGVGAYCIRTAHARQGVYNTPLPRRMIKTDMGLR